MRRPGDFGGPSFETLDSPFVSAEASAGEDSLEPGEDARGDRENPFQAFGESETAGPSAFELERLAHDEAFEGIDRLGSETGEELESADETDLRESEDGEADEGPDAPAYREAFEEEGDWEWSGREDLTGSASRGLEPAAPEDEVDEVEEALVEAEAADSTLPFEQFQVDPDYNTNDPELLPDVWPHADKIRLLIENRKDSTEADREELTSALVRQIPTVVLYWQATEFLKAVEARTTTSKTLTLYILLFPGEAKDNTGIKDLNDRILGYQLNAKYIRRRQQEISKLFWRPGDKFLLVGQDYKTASVLTLQGTREEFATRLSELDGKLRDILLKEILPLAEKDAKSKGESKRLDEIKKLRKTLEKNKKYTFDIFFGLSKVEPKGAIGGALDVTYLLVTESLKGAGLARLVAKGLAVKSSAAKSFAKGMKADARGLDPRGKEYQSAPYLAATRKAGDIKKLMTTPYHRDRPADYYHIYVETVWTFSFLKYRRWFVGNPEVIRAVRKKSLEQPRLRDGNIKYNAGTQRELLEFWLVVLNMLDFVKDFLSPEFRTALARYQADALAAHAELRRRPFAKLDWPRLERLLTNDFRQSQRIAVLGTTSEFQFYSYAADYSARIFFSMDIRDLGVALMLVYENSNEEIEHSKYTDIKLMEETFRSTDPICEQRRFTYDQVVDVFRKYWAIVGKSPAATMASVAQKAFGVDVQGPFPAFTRAVQVMLGGDEVFVAAHPYFASVVHQIINDLDRIPLASGTLNVRTAVAYSNAARGQSQRELNQKSHNQAMTLADAAPATLKRLEATHRRIHRLIEKLEENPKKKDLAPGYRQKLDDLRLLKKFVRIYHARASASASGSNFTKLLPLLNAADIAGATNTGHFELVDFNGTVADGTQLEKEAARLEEEVRRKVGTDNMHADPPPVTKLPAWIEKLLDKILPKDPNKP